MNTSKCPVCDWAINDGGIKVTVGGKEITVCCDECAEKAKQDPAQYAAARAVEAQKADRRDSHRSGNT